MPVLGQTERILWLLRWITEAAPAKITTDLLDMIFSVMLCYVMFVPVFINSSSI